MANVIIRNIPNTITCCNLFSGCIASYMALQGCYTLAFLFIVIGGQVHPAEEIISRTLAGCQKRMCILNLRSHCSVFVLANKALQVSAFQFQCHFYCLLFA